MITTGGPRTVEYRIPPVRFPLRVGGRRGVTPVPGRRVDLNQWVDKYPETETTNIKAETQTKRRGDYSCYGVLRRRPPTPW